MDEYIEREALKERFRKRIKWLEKDVHDQYSLGLFHGCEYDADLINEPPAADVAPVRRGRWKRIGENHEKCTHCGYIFEALPSQYFFEMNNKFCRMCGAKMDLEG